MSVQIATAAEEQSAVTEEISRNVNNIMTISNHTVTASDDTTEATEALIAEVNKLKDMVKQFKVI
jgi:methyl-accepting chemotaxis protein